MHVTMCVVYCVFLIYSLRYLDHLWILSVIQASCFRLIIIYFYNLTTHGAKLPVIEEVMH